MSRQKLSGRHALMTLVRELHLCSEKSPPTHRSEPKTREASGKLIDHELYCLYLWKVVCARRQFSIIVSIALLGLILVTSTSKASVVIEQIGADIDGENSGDQSGYSVSLSADGTTVAIGAWLNGGNGTNSGHVRIYQWNGSTWTQKGSDIDGEAAGDYSGISVSLSADGTTVAIGADYNDGNGTNSGHVRIYQWNAGTTSWTQKGSDINGEAANDSSGISVSLSDDGTTVAIGAKFNDGNGSDSGHVRIYQWNAGTTSWTQKGSDINGEAADDQSGISVSLSADGTTVAIGAWLNDGNGTNSGHVRIYRWNTGTSQWTKLGSDLDGEAADDYLGVSVSLSDDGTTVAIGADFNDGNGTNSGHVRVYQWNAGTTSWTQLGSDIDGEAAGDYFGASVSLTADGTTVAIGADYNDGNGSNSGHVRIYHWNGSTWTQRGSDIDGEAVDDYSGWSVALSDDGTTIAIGAPGNRSNSGHVRIYSLSTITPPTAVTPVTPIWRVTLDPNGGTCVDSTERTEPWTSVFVGYRYLPGASDCTRTGYSFAGWGSTANPSTPVTLPNLVDPSDNQRRAFLAANADLIAMWTPDPNPIADVTVFANFLCGPCTTIWLIHPPVASDVVVDITIDDTPTTCSIQGDAFGLTFCQITPLTPGDHSITLTPRNGTITGPPTNTTITLRT
jgi:hypothetical protein